MALTPDEQALARVVDIITMIPERRITRLRSGSDYTARVGVPVHLFLELVDAIEAARPGWVERTREQIKKDQEARDGTAQ